MVNKENWRSALGFSQRLSTLTRIVSAYQKSQPSLSAVDARRTATVLEAKIYDEAQSQHDYENRSQKSIRELNQLAIPEACEQDQLEAEDLSESDPPVAIDIGPYKHAVFYREGLFSVIYRAPAPGHLTYFAPDAPPKSKVVALKLTNPAMMEPPHDSYREARILEISKSPHVIPVLETFREVGTRFVLVLPFMPYDLDHLLQHDLLSKQRTKSCLRDLFGALAFIHERDVIHRDVKPSNILLKSLDGPAYLADFGIAWAPSAPGAEFAGSKITDVGTTCYRPPELLFGNKKYNCSLDLWAAGCTVAETLIPDHATLFEAGDLGSELALIQSIFKKLGTPNLEVWPEAAQLPDWGKVEFVQYSPQPWSSLLPKASAVERDLVSKLVQYESGARMTAAQVLRHPFFDQ